MANGRLRRILVTGSIVAVTLTGACGKGTTGVSAQSTIVMVRVANRDGSAPGPDAMNAVRETLAHRMTAAALPNPAVTVDGSILHISFGGTRSTTELNLLLAAGQVRFRKVIDSVFVPPPTAPVMRPGPASSSAQPTSGPLPQQSAVLAKVGGAGTVAAAISDPSNLDAATTRALQPFAALTAAEVTVLPPGIQFAVPQVSCEVLNNRPLGAIDDTAATVVACQSGGHTKYLLDSANLVGADVADASAAKSNDGVNWKVDLTFTSDAVHKWTDLTTEAFENTGGECRATQPNANGGAGVCMVAILLDNEVVSAPAIQGVLASTCQITGAFPQQNAVGLAAEIRGGAIPYQLTIVSISTPSPSPTPHA